MYKLNPEDIEFSVHKGSGPGGQHKNKTSSAVRATHMPTGITVSVNGRSQHANKRQAVIELTFRVQEYFDKKKANKKKNNRDEKIKERNIIRTYNFAKGYVKDHRSGKKVPIKEIMEKGRIDLLR